MNIKAAVAEQKEGRISIENVELGEPKEGEVLVKIAACGICHTDEVGRLGFFPSPSLPFSVTRVQAPS